MKQAWQDEEENYNYSSSRCQTLFTITLILQFGFSAIATVSYVRIMNTFNLHEV